MHPTKTYIAYKGLHRVGPESIYSTPLSRPYVGSETGGLTHSTHKNTPYLPSTYIGYPHTLIHTTSLVFKSAQNFPVYKINCFHLSETNAMNTVLDPDSEPESSKQMFKTADDTSPTKIYWDNDDPSVIWRHGEINPNFNRGEL